MGCCIAMPSNLHLRTFSGAASKDIRDRDMSQSMAIFVGNRMIN